MGGHYGSVQVRGGDRRRVVEVASAVARARGGRCLVGPASNGWIGVYPQENGQDHTFGEAMAAQLSGDVLHVLVHDDDVMAYWYWRDGVQIDSYWSKPGYFGEADRAEQEAMSGRPELLADFASERQVRELLRRDVGHFTFESERLRAFADLLGITNAVTAYEYLKNGETDGIIGWRQFEEAPAAEVKRALSATQQKKRQETERIKRLKRDGVLLAHVVKKGWTPRATVTTGGFALAWQGWGPPTVTVELYVPPWKEAESLSLDVQPQVNAWHASRDGRRLAAALGSRVVVWDVETRKVVLELPEKDWAISAALSPDGRCLVQCSRDEMCLTEVDTGTRLRSLPGSGHRSFTFHPSGRWLVADGQTLAILALDGDPRDGWREFCVGGRHELSQEFEASIREQMAAIDVDAAEREFRASMESFLAENSVLDADRRETMRQEMLKQWEQSAAFLRESRSGRRPEPLRGMEEPGAIWFSDDGSWLALGTQYGLRLYLWHDVLGAAGQDMPPPARRYDTVTEADRMFGKLGHVYALTGVPGSKEILFGGIDGKVRRMDLGSGAVMEVLSMSEGEPVISVLFSLDGGTIGVVSRPGMLEARGPRDNRGVWSVWSYAALIAT